MGIGLITAVLVVGALSAIPTAATGVLSAIGVSPAASSSSSSQPVWNSGNLCSWISDNPVTGDVNCVSLASDSYAPLWYNFSAGEVQGGVVNVWVYGSNDCIYMNFHSFDTTINIHLFGSDYSCPSHPSTSSSGWGPVVAGSSDWGNQKGNGCSSYSQWPYVAWLDPAWVSKPTSCPTGVNIVVNAELDIVNLLQTGSNYATNVTIYGTTTVVNAAQIPKRCSGGAENLNTTIIYVGTTAGFATCPSGITYGRVSWTELARGSHDTFNTIFVDGTNVHVLPPNSPYSTVPLLPPEGVLGFHDLYGSETTTTAPSGSCHYLGA